MGENVLDVKTVNEVIGESFYIPSYQRGYRWTDKEVLALLDDIYEFRNKYNNSKSYCLQPVVLLPDEREEKNKWIVLDGQQRLTTIYIILSYLNFGEDIYTLSYETRSGSEVFLKEMKNRPSLDRSNIDYYFMTNAFFTIKKWFEEKKEKGEHTIKNNMISYLGEKVYLIWYEIHEEYSDPIDVFTRLNMGKIPLSNAELIKAKLLNDENFTKGVDFSGMPLEVMQAKKELITRNKLSIAHDWDWIEQELHNDSFWAFLNKGFPLADNRINFIFQFFYIVNNKKDPTDYDVFSYINDLLEESESDPVKIWKEIKSYYLTLQEWFNNRVIYHLLGFIITANLESLSNIYSKIYADERKITKSEFKKILKKIIRDNFLKDMDLDSLSYQNNKDKRVLNNVLLLFNILQVLQPHNETNHFSFHRYKRDRWSLEHIHAQNSELLDTKRTRENWLLDHKNALLRIEDANPRSDISDTIMKIEDTIQDIDNLITDKFTSLHNEVIKHFQVEDEDLDSLDIHSISNMALLDRDTNSKLNNSVFEIKRHKILESDRQGKYILPATRDVFLKYYTKNPDHLAYWTSQDQQDYLAKIKSTISSYFKMPLGDM